MWSFIFVIELYNPEEEVWVPFSIFKSFIELIGTSSKSKGTKNEN